MALSDANQDFAPQTSIGMTDNVEFDTMTPATKELLRKKTKAEKVVAYYGLMVPNKGNPWQPYNVNNKQAREKLGVGKCWDCVEPVFSDSMNWDTVPVLMVSPKAEHEAVLKEYCRALWLGIVDEYDQALKIVKNVWGARNALTKLNAMGLPVSQFQDKKETIDTTDLDIEADALETNPTADEQEQWSDSTADEPVDATSSTVAPIEEAIWDEGEQDTVATETWPVKEQIGTDSKWHTKVGNWVSKLPTKLTNKSK